MVFDICLIEFHGIFNKEIYSVHGRKIIKIVIVKNYQTSGQKTIQNKSKLASICEKFPKKCEIIYNVFYMQFIEKQIFYGGFRKYSTLTLEPFKQRKNQHVVAILVSIESFLSFSKLG